MTGLAFPRPVGRHARTVVRRGTPIARACGVVAGDLRLSSLPVGCDFDELQEFVIVRRKEGARWIRVDGY